MWLILVAILSGVIVALDQPEKESVFVKEERSRVHLEDDHSGGGITRLLDT